MAAKDKNGDTVLHLLFRRWSDLDDKLEGLSASINRNEVEDVKADMLAVQEAVKKCIWEGGVESNDRSDFRSELLDEKNNQGEPAFRPEDKEKLFQRYRGEMLRESTLATPEPVQCACRHPVLARDSPPLVRFTSR